MFLKAQQQPPWCNKLTTVSLGVHAIFFIFLLMQV